MNARSRRLLATYLLMAAALAACSGSGMEPAPSVTGTWTGRVTVNAELAPTVTLNLVEAADGGISGSGHLATDDGSYSVEVTIGAGTNNFPAINFAILNPTRGDIFFGGTMDQAGTSIRGTLNGTGMENLPLDLLRR